MLKTRELLLLGAAILCVFLFFGKDLLEVTPVGKFISLRKVVSLKEAKWMHYNQLLAQEKDLDQYLGRFQSTDSKNNPSSAETRFIAFVEEKANKAGIKINSLRPQSSLQIELTAVSTLKNLTEFIHLVTYSPELIRVRNLTIRSASTPAQVQTTLLITKA